MFRSLQEPINQQNDELQIKRQRVSLDFFPVHDDAHKRKLVTGACSDDESAEKISVDLSWIYAISDDPLHGICGEYSGDQVHARVTATVLGDQ